jgi:hypothetical protein
MLVNDKEFDGSTSYTEEHRRLTSYAGNAVWFPNFSPRTFPQRKPLRRLLTAFYRDGMSCFMTGAFVMAAAGVLNSFNEVVVFVALTAVNSRLVNVIFQREDPDFYANFSLNGFDFDFTGHENGLDV